jgi:hypothetical protein
MTFRWTLPTSGPKAPQITSTPGNDGTGRAYGVELYLARQARSASDRVSGWLSYTWGRAERTAWTVRVQSGFPYSVPLGVRVAAVEDTADVDGDGNTTELVPRRDAAGLPVWTVDYGNVRNVNSGRLPIFARVDLRVTFRPRWQNDRWQLYAEVINLLNRKNGGLKAELAYDPTSNRPRIITVRDASLSLLPSIGVRFKF